MEEREDVIHMRLGGKGSREMKNKVGRVLK